MKIEKIRIKNFRGIQDETIYLNDYNTFVGVNGAGKSTILNALNIFFRNMNDVNMNTSKMIEDDFHKRKTNIPIEITITFVDLSDAAKKKFSDYVRQEKLVITSKAIFDEEQKYAEIKQIGQRLAIHDFSIYFEKEKEKAKVDQLREIYNKIRSKYKNLPSKKTKKDMGDALRQYEQEFPQDCELIPSEDSFYGFSKGHYKLEKYVQWVYIPAQKDATLESQENTATAFCELLKRAVKNKVDFSSTIDVIKSDIEKKYTSMINENQKVLEEVSDKIERRLNYWAYSNAEVRINWQNDIEKSVKIEEPKANLQLNENGFWTDITRVGNGIQRSYIFALLEELNSQPNNDKSKPTLIIGIEEPEVFQHPPVIRKLADVLYELSSTSQLMICTHHYHFIRPENINTIYLVKKLQDDSGTKILNTDYSEIMSKVNDDSYTKETLKVKLYPTLTSTISEMFFCNKIILTEGVEDVSYIYEYMRLNEGIRRINPSDYQIIPVFGKNNIPKSLLIALSYKIPTFLVFDSDSNIKEKQKKTNKETNRLILDLLGYKKVPALSKEHLFKKNLCMIKNSMTETIKEEYGDMYREYYNRVQSKIGEVGNMKKNPIFIKLFLEETWKDKIRCNFLDNLISHIYEFLNDI